MRIRTLVLMLAIGLLIPLWMDISEAQVKKESKFKGSGYDWEDREIDGMKYRLYFKDTTPGNPNPHPMLWVINLTKDRLECDKLTKGP